MDELRACIELGFGFAPESPDLDPKLVNTIPALGFYCAVNRQYGKSLSRSSSTSSFASECTDSGSVGGDTIVDPGKRNLSASEFFVDECFWLIVCFDDEKVIPFLPKYFPVQAELGRTFANVLKPSIFKSFLLILFHSHNETMIHNNSRMF